MSKIYYPKARLDLDADPLHALVVEADSFDDMKDSWAVLSIWWRRNEQRPFLALVEFRGYCNFDTSCRSGAFGTLEAAVSFFQPTNLRDKLIHAIPTDYAERFPDANMLRREEGAKRTAARFYAGSENLTDLLAWLYPEIGADWEARADAFEADFGVPGVATVSALANGGKLVGPLASGIFAAMRHFDRDRWLREKKRAGVAA